MCRSQLGYLAVRVCPSHSELSRSIAHCLSAIDVGHTPRDLSRCVGHNRVISRSVTHRAMSRCVHHTAPRDIMVRLQHSLSAIDVGHTPHDLWRCVGLNWVISRYGCVRHTASYHGPSHTACPPSMSVTHRVIYRGVAVTTGLSRCTGVSVTQRDIVVHHTLPVRHRCRSHTV